MPRPTVFFIVGPTASGKTDAAVFAAKKLNGEVVSADSIQIYRGLDKGSAKPSEEEKQGIPHHLIDIVDYTDETYNVACFARDAAEKINEIAARGKLPIVAGGTGLYVNSLLYPLDFTEVKPDKTVREMLMSEEKNSPGSLYERLRTVDPASAQRLHPNDTKRIVRALEVYLVTGKTMTEQGGDFANEREAEIRFVPVIAGITMERSRLYDRINRRVDIMLRNGLEEEARELYLSSGKKLPLSLQAIGYRQFIAYFEGEATYDETVEIIKRETRRFAKRQISWFKRDKRIRWFSLDDFGSKDDMNEAITKYFEEEKDRIERAE
ncbi:MAG: tRNA (adenosine(37)-N6)-dimethylallyltransferase MiaA [Clostridiales bacterium]|nr:tRNA (adenosine(37)-N6)-dimethylallyltransferase MiaA [Clostridiales bacterium]